MVTYNEEDDYCYYDDDDAFSFEVHTRFEYQGGETFTFTETLFEYEDYVPDLQPHQVDARTRALADVCLAVLNSNEFVYLY